MSSPHHIFSRRLRSEHGVALVEFALVMPLLFLLVFGMLDFGKAFNYWIDATHLSAEGARLAVVNSDKVATCSPGGPATLQCYIKQRADTLQLSKNAIVCISYPNGATATQPVQVDVLTSYTWLPLTLKVGSTILTGSATMRLETNPDATRIPAGDGGTAVGVPGGLACP